MGSVARCGGGGFEVRRFRALTAGRPRDEAVMLPCVISKQARARARICRLAKHNHTCKTSQPDRHKSAGGGCHRYEFVEPQAEP